jgi:Fe-S-cluster containining protein
MEHPLARPYTCRLGVPTVGRVDDAIFVATYFGHCMDCTYCRDSCCQYGCEVERPRYEALLAHADELEAYLGVARSRWFRDHWQDDPDYPGGECIRSAAVPEAEFPGPVTLPRADLIDAACVFLNRQGRGCRIHSFCLERGVDVHDLKPMICLLFPVSFTAGLLMPALEIRERSLACLGPGPTVYRSARADVEYYFGPELVAELDALEKVVLAGAGAARGGARSLPVVPG